MSICLSVYLTEFNLFTDTHTHHLSPTCTGAAAGLSEYLCPEELRGCLHVTRFLPLLPLQGQWQGQGRWQLDVQLVHRHGLHAASRAEGQTHAVQLAGHGLVLLEVVAQHQQLGAQLLASAS